MKGEASLSIKAIVAIVISTVGIAWGISWTINAYLFSEKQEKQATSQQIIEISKQLSKISTDMQKINKLDSIIATQKQQGRAINGIIKATQCILKTTVTNRNTLINIWEQLPPLLSEKKKEPQRSTPLQNQTASLGSTP
jgi:uncharacterized membrane protein YcjF (UPF0283 family)